MENPNNDKQQRKQDKQKMGIRVGVGGCSVGGIVLWGGLVAIATFLSLSAIKFKRKRLNTKNHHSPAPPPPAPLSSDVSKDLESNNKNDDQIEGKGLLHVLLQDSSSPKDHYPSRDEQTEIPATQIDSTSLDYTKSLTMDDKSVPNISTEQNKKPTYLEILLSDDSKSKNIISLPVFDRPSKNESTEDVEINDFIEEGKVIEEPDQAQLTGKEGEDEVEYEDGENLLEIKEAIIETKQSNKFAVEEVTIVEKGEVAIETTQKKDQFAVEVVDLEVIEEVMEEDEATHGGENDKEPKDYFHEKMIVEKGEEAIETMFAVEVEMEPIEVMEEEEDDEAAEVKAEDNHSQMQLIVEEEEEEDSDDVNEDEEETAEKGEESSEGTGDSSLESNSEAIWPAEAIEELSIQFNEAKMENQKSEEKIDEYKAVKTEQVQGYFNSAKKGDSIYYNEDSVKSIIIGSSKRRNIKELLIWINESTVSANLSIWIWTTAVVVLLLLLFAPLILSPASIVKLCLIAFLVVILSKV